MNEKCYTNITPQKWTRICSAAAKQSGIIIDTDAGQGEALGVTLKWEYQRESKALYTEIVNHPFWIPVESAMSFIDGIIQTA